MNLRQIADAAAKVLLERYRNLQEIDKRNFFFVLASKLAPFILDRRKQPKEKLVTSFNVNGNSVQLTIPGNVIVINGQKFTPKGNGVTWLSNLVHEIFAAESNGTLTIKRPEGFTRKKERLEFKKAEGTVFVQIVNSVAYATGEQDLEVKGTGAGKLYLSSKQYEDVKNKDAFEERSNKETNYYVKKGTHVIDITGCGKPARYVIYALTHADKAQYAGFLARTGNLAEILLEPDVTNPEYVVVVGKEVFIATAHEGREPSIKEIKVNKMDIPEPRVTAEERDAIEQEYEEFRKWCKANGKPVTKKSYAEYAKH